MADYALGPFRLDTHNGLLFRGTEPVALGRRAVTLLQVLVERRGTPVSKDALIEAAWPGLAVEESNLSVQMAAIRKVLAEAPGGARWIETMPRRGYRFVGPTAARGAGEGTVAPVPADAARVGAPIRRGAAERRLITILSCELIGVASETGGIGLEDLREAVGKFQRCVSEVADCHGGFVARCLGNNVLALFGYPQAHEHDAEQAVRAGLALCACARALGADADTPMRCHVGIATGMVIVGSFVEVGVVQDHQIVGDAPNAAARQMISAPADAVAIDRATRRLIGDLFDCREAGAIATATGTAPVRSWQVLGEGTVESRFEALHGAVLNPLLGRDEEIDLLLRRWARAKAGDGQIVLVSGEAGIGKSRIVAALDERLFAEPHLRLRYFCSPHHQDSALFPVMEQLSHAASFAREETAATKLEKLKALLARAMPPDEDIAFIADLMSLTTDRHPLPGLSPQRRKQRTLQALVRQLEGLARQQPVVVVFEDAHWIDPTSHELLDLIVERIRSLPALLIATFRPEFQPPWTGQPHVTALALNRLDRRDRAALIAQIAGGKALPDEIAGQIADHTDGVPLFVEEVTRSILDSGLLREEADRWMLDSAPPTFAIPPTLHASLLARLDHLGPARWLAQIGAAIGRQFSYGLLQAVARLQQDELQAALTCLVASGLVFQRGMPPDAIYSFKHALVQDAAHGSLLRKARQRLHAEIAEALETRSPEIAASQPEILAQHYAEAGLVEKAVACWSKAADRSVARSALAEAAAQFQRALGQLALLPDNLERQRQELELQSAVGAVLLRVKGNAAPETGRAYARARALWEQLGSPPGFLKVSFGQSLHHAIRGELAFAHRLDEELLRLSRQRKDSGWLVLSHYSFGRNLMYGGEFAASRSNLEEAYALYDPVRHCSLTHPAELHPQVGTLAYMGNTLLCLGFPDQALARVNAAIDEARRLAHPPSLAPSLAIGARLLLIAGDAAALNERTDELVAVTTERGFPYWRAQAAIYRGWVKIKTDDVAEGIALLQNGLSIYRATNAELFVPHYLGLLAVGHGTAGRLDEGLIRLDEALQIAGRTGEHWFTAELYRHKGQLLLRQGHADAAEELYRKSLGIARAQAARLWELRAATSLARLRRDQGRRTEARGLLAPVHGWFTEGFATPDLKEAGALLDELGEEGADRPKRPRAGASPRGTPAHDAAAVPRVALHPPPLSGGR